MLKRGDIVWAKMPGFPYWPAIVIDSQDCGRDDHNNKEKLWLFWFADHKVSQMPLDKINDFVKEYSKHFLKGKGKKFTTAVQEALSVLAENSQQNFLESSDLFEWAANGFKNQSLFLPKKVKGLPKMVSETLKRKEFKRRLVNDSDQEDDSGEEDTESMEEDENDDAIKNLLPDVLNGVKDLEDICIACCKTSAIVVKKHPCFIGGICQACKRIVEFSCKMPFGVPQDYCAVCGQGGLVIICSNSMCLKSFCSLCIEYMTRKGTFKKALRDVNWMCFFCDSRDRCLIIPRSKVTSQENVITPISVNKPLINVLAHSDTILSVLRSKRFEIGKFATEIPHLKRNNLDEPHEFIKEKFENLSPNFVCGSYLKDSPMLEVSNEDVDLLFDKFYSFLYNLDHARLVNQEVLFAFLLNANNYLLQERLSHFLELFM